jgi:hypothetical protein
MVVLVNANDEQQVFSAGAFKGKKLMLHFVQRTSVDPVVKTAKFNAKTGTFTIPGRTTAIFVEYEHPKVRLTNLIADVRALELQGVLNQGQANSLVSKLQTAIKRIDTKQPAQAAAQLGSFINQVQDLMNTGVLTPDQAWPLIDTATDIREQILAKMY